VYARYIENARIEFLTGTIRVGEALLLRDTTAGDEGKPAKEMTAVEKEKEKNEKEKRTSLRHFMSGHGVGPIVRHLNLSFKQPVQFPDTLVIGTRVDPDCGFSAESDRVNLQHCIVSVASGRVCCEAADTIVFLDYTKKLVATVPAIIFQAMTAIGGGNSGKM
jgi:acyl-CoA thioesterase FadM